MSSQARSIATLRQLTPFPHSARRRLPTRTSMSTAIAQQKIRIRLKAFDRRMLDLSCDKIIETADHTAATAIGPIPLPTKRKIYCVLRSPHVDKDSVNTLRRARIAASSTSTAPRPRRSTHS